MPDTLSTATADSPTLRNAYMLFRLERQGQLLAAATLEHYDRWVHHRPCHVRRSTTYSGVP